MQTATVIFLTLCLPLPVAAEDSWSLSISGYAGRNIGERASRGLDDSELPTQTVQGDGTLSGVRVIPLLASLSPITFTSSGGTVNFQARCMIGAAPAFPAGRWYPALFTEYKRAHVSHDFDFIQVGSSLGLTFEVNHFVAGLGVHS